MQKLLCGLMLLCGGLQAAVVTNVQPLSGSKFGLVSTMSVTDLMAIEINLVPKGITLSNYLRLLTNNSVASLTTTGYVNNIMNGLASTGYVSTVTTTNNLWTNAAGVVRTIAYPNAIRLGTNVDGLTKVQFGNKSFVNGSAGLPGEAYIYSDNLSTNRSYFSYFVEEIGGSSDTYGFWYELDPNPNTNWVGNFGTAALLVNTLPPNGKSLIPYAGNGQTALDAQYTWIQGSLSNGSGAGMVGTATSDASMQFGAAGSATPFRNGQTNVGVFGTAAINTKTGGANIGGYFEIAALGGNLATVPTYESAALLADSRTIASPILLLRTNGSVRVVWVDNSGKLYLTNDLAAIHGVPYVWPAAQGAAGTILQNNGSGTLTWGNTLSGGAAFDNIIVTNGVNHIRSLVPSTGTTNQINVATGPQYYYWTNMVTNVVLQLTNVFSLGVTNRTLDFFFTGATNNGPNYTVAFTCPNPAGLIVHWGLYSATNGATAFTVTNNLAAGASLTFWESNLVEAYYSPTR